MNYLLIFAFSLILSLLLTPLARFLAIKVGIIDQPNSARWHLKPTPLMGGVALVLSFITACFIWGELSHGIIALFAGGLLVFALGVFDDIKGTIYWVKLPGHLAAALILIISGTRVGLIPQIWLSVPLSILWIMVLTNSFNLLDNTDGLSAGIAFIVSLGLSFFFLLEGTPLLALLSLALAGSCLGFLRYNFHPAKIFMGDCGSTFLGYILAGITLMGSWHHSSSLVFALVTPLVLLGVPLFDTTLVFVDRLLHGKFVTQGGKDHASHRLLLLGFSPGKATLFLYLACGILFFASYIISQALPPVALAALVLTTGGFLYLGVKLKKVHVYENITARDKDRRKVSKESLTLMVPGKY